MLARTPFVLGAMIDDHGFSSQKMDRIAVDMDGTDRHRAPPSPSG
jgi:hypothetical protein